MNMNDPNTGRIGPHTHTQSSQELPIAAQLMTLIVGKMSTQLIYVAAVLGIADLLEEGPQQVEGLAKATQTNPDALYRVLRALTTMGIFSESETAPRHFALTPLAEPLRSSVPDSVKEFAIFNGSDWHNGAWSKLLYSVKTGEPTFHHVFGTDLFDFLRHHPDQFQVFNEAMTAMAQQEVHAIIQSYNWKTFHTVADIGGGHGKLMAELLKAYPSLHGIQFDLPEVVVGSHSALKEAGVANRCEIIGGNFFETIPPGADAYILKLVLHDWDNDNAKRILQGCRRVMQPGSLILVVDAVLPPANEGFVQKVTDVEMLVMTSGGQERTVGELFSEAGFRLTAVIQTPTRFSIMEGQPI